MRRREVEAMIALIKRQQEFLTADESASLERFETAMMPPRADADYEQTWNTEWLATVGQDKETLYARNL